MPICVVQLLIVHNSAVLNGGTGVVNLCFPLVVKHEISQEKCIVADRRRKDGLLRMSCDTCAVSPKVGSSAPLFE